MLSTIDPEREGKGAAADLDQEGRDDGEGQGELDDELRPDAGDRLDLHEAREALDGLEHHVQADAAAGDLGDGVGRGEALGEDELDGLAVGEALVPLQEAPLDGLPSHVGGVDAGAVVHDGDHDVARLLGRRKEDGPGRGLPARDPRLRGLDAVVHAVSDQVDEGLADLVDDGLVDPGVVAFEDELDLLALLPGEIAHHAREALEDVPDRQHPDVHDGLLELRRDPGDLLDRVQEPLGQGAVLQRVAQLLARLGELRPVDDQLPHEVQQVVELGEVDPHRAGAGGDVLCARPPAVVAREAWAAKPGAAAASAAMAAPPGVGTTRGVRTRSVSRTAFSGARSRTSAFSRQACSTASRRAVAPAKSRSKTAGFESDPAVDEVGEDVLEAVDVVLDGREAHHSAVPLQGVERAQDRRHDVGVQTLPLEAQEAVIEGFEVSPSVLEVDVQQLLGDLEVRHGIPLDVPRRR